MSVIVRRGFSLIELVIVAVMLGILAAMVVPSFAGATEQARTASTQSTLAGVRSALAQYRANAVIAGESPYPTLQMLETAGAVMDESIPANPFTGVDGVQSVSAGDAASRAVVAPASAGWNYFVDVDADPPVAIFYANSDADTTEVSAGEPVPASEL